MIFCNNFATLLIISCWTYPNYYYWDWCSLVFFLLNLNNSALYFLFESNWAIPENIHTQPRTAYMS